MQKSLSLCLCRADWTERVLLFYIWIIYTNTKRTRTQFGSARSVKTHQAVWSRCHTDRGHNYIMRFQCLLLAICCQFCVDGSFGHVNDLEPPSHHRKSRAAVVGVASELRLIEEPSCADIRSQCVNLPPHADNLQTLECVQTFLTSQVEGLSDDCQHAIWRHTTQLLDDRNVVCFALIILPLESPLS